MGNILELQNLSFIDFNEKFTGIGFQLPSFSIELIPTLGYWFRGLVTSQSSCIALSSNIF